MAQDCTIAIVAPSLFVSITIEASTADELPEIHLHAGGQGIWVARMLAHLGEAPVVCGPLGGETGRALRGLAREWDIALDGVLIEGASPAYVHDRRSGERRELARSAVPTLDRHEVDELYGRVLERALATGLCVVTGRTAATVTTDFYDRLGRDLDAADVPAVGDLHGPELDAFLEGGAFAWLKVSEQDLVEDGRLDEDAAEPDVIAAAEALARRGVGGVVVSRADGPAVAVVDGTRLRVSGPTLEAVDRTGTGDSMTAALAVAVRRRLGTKDALRLAWAAGAANVLRRGLGSADGGLIDRLADQVQIHELGGA